jgi:hypothetical protein
MSDIYLSPLAGKPLKAYLESCGHNLIFVKDESQLPLGMRTHPDLKVCKIGALPGSGVILSDAPTKPDYPEDAAFCAVILEGYLIHRLDITAPNILKYGMEQNFQFIDVRQGYTKCSTVVVDDRSVITSDPGIIKALSPFPDISVLAVTSGYVTLTGFPYGFLGGASGRVGNEIIFNGDLSKHPDFTRICEFIKRRGLAVRYFTEYELEDIGSIIEA